MGRERVISSSSPGDDDEPIPGRGPAREHERRADESLRPKRLDDLIGQKDVIDRLRINLTSAKIRQEPMPHVLFDGPPGLGKTTLATVIPAELGVDFQMTSGPALSKPADIMPYLTNMNSHSVLFIDEIHRLPKTVEEFIYSAMEDFRVDWVAGEGLGARTISIPLKPFTLVGATTRSGMLTGPMRDRFIIREHLDFYTDSELAQIVRVNAKKLGVIVDADGITELAGRSRGTPRIANSLLYWVRDFALSKSLPSATADAVRSALLMKRIDQLGLDRQDRRFLETLARVFNGGPTGIDAIASTMNVPSDTLSEEVEPFLLRKELIVRTPRGRQITIKGYDHLTGLKGDLAIEPLPGKRPKKDPPTNLFE